jgi:hypothetical protein
LEDAEDFIGSWKRCSFSGLCDLSSVTDDLDAEEPGVATSSEISPLLVRLTSVTLPGTERVLVHSAEHSGSRRRFLQTLMFRNEVIPPHPFFTSLCAEEERFRGDWGVY